MKDNWPEGEPYPFGIHASHTWDELGAIFRVIQDFNIRTFVELGVFKGGLASMITARLLFVSGFYYVGVEKSIEFITHPFLKGSYILPGDVFSPVMINSVLEAMRLRPKNCLIYCDNGDKPREVNTYLPVVPKGTFVMAHDWGTEITQHDLDMIDPKLYVRHIPEYFEGTRLLLLEAV